jgi:hypothetical protein
MDAQNVWWGWWRKANEPMHIDELGQLRDKSRKEPLEIGLYDRSSARFFSAQMRDCVFDDRGSFISTPDAVLTPAYYRNEKLPAWFKLSKIDSVQEEEFVKKFLRVPVGEYTFFGVSADETRAPLETRKIAGDIVPALGDAVVHVSDLHFGSDFGYPLKSAPGSFPLLQILAEDIISQSKKLGVKVGLMVVSGDTSSRGDASHLFNTAKPFLHDLCKRINLPPENVVIVPGNHDISFQDFALTYDHEAAFNGFIQTFYGSARKQVDLLRFRLASNKIVEILTINSVKLRTKETSNYGWVDWRAYEELLNGADKTDEDTLRIAVMHHHLVPSLREEKLPEPGYPYGSVSVTLNAPAIIEGLQRFGFEIVMHGHQHNPAVNRISRARLSDRKLELECLEQPLYVIASGSTGVKLERIEGDIRENTYGILTTDTPRHIYVRQFNPSGNVRDLYSARLS